MWIVENRHTKQRGILARTQPGLELRLSHTPNSALQQPGFCVYIPTLNTIQAYSPAVWQKMGKIQSRAFERTTQMALQN